MDKRKRGVESLSSFEAAAAGGGRRALFFSLFFFSLSITDSLASLSAPPLPWAWPPKQSKRSVDTDLRQGGSSKRIKREERAFDSPWRRFLGLACEKESETRGDVFFPRFRFCSLVFLLSLVLSSRIETKNEKKARRADLSFDRLFAVALSSAAEIDHVGTHRSGDVVGSIVDEAGREAERE